MNPVASYRVKAVPHNPATAFVRNMGIGINIGNTLDAIGTFEWHSGENGWGNPDISREFIKALKDYGYKTIRLPVTWGEYIGPGPDYHIGRCVFMPNCEYNCPNRMDRVEEVVNWILDEDMYCILNLHHDGGTSDLSWILDAAKDPEGINDKFVKVWTQIAVRFRDASDRLILEAMNEVGFDSLWNRWNPATSDMKPEAYRLVNMLNQTFVDTVRTTGGNNANRFLLVCGYWTDFEASADPLFVMPKDTLEHRLILSLHYYTPALFCVVEEDQSWGKNMYDWGYPGDYDELVRLHDIIRSTFIDKGIPIINGEYGVSIRNKDQESRTKWMIAVTQISLNHGICPVLWDTGWKIDDDGIDYGGEIKRHPPFEMRYTLRQALDSIVYR